MTEPSANRKIHFALGIQSGMEKVDYYPWLRLSNTQLFPGPPESLKPHRFSCCLRDQSLFIYYVVFIIMFHYLILCSICSLYFVFTPC